MDQTNDPSDLMSVLLMLFFAFHVGCCWQICSIRPWVATLMVTLRKLLTGFVLFHRKNLTAQDRYKLCAFPPVGGGGDMAVLPMGRCLVQPYARKRRSPLADAREARQTYLS